MFTARFFPVIALPQVTTMAFYERFTPGRDKTKGAVSSAGTVVRRSTAPLHVNGWIGGGRKKRGLFSAGARSSGEKTSPALIEAGQISGYIGN